MRIFRTVIVILSILSMILLWSGYGFRINQSESLPNILYFSKPVDKIQLNDIVTFQLPQSPVIFAKIVAGLPGDNVEIYNNKLHINNIELGSIVAPFEPIPSLVIPEGYFFALGSHPESFDSRYFEFGLVPQNAVKEKLCTIF